MNVEQKIFRSESGYQVALLRRLEREIHVIAITWTISWYAAVILLHATVHTAGCASISGWSWKVKIVTTTGVSSIAFQSHISVRNSPWHERFSLELTWKSRYTKEMHYQVCLRQSDANPSGATIGAVLCTTADLSQKRGCRRSAKCHLLKDKGDNETLFLLYQKHWMDELLLGKYNSF